jgi:signal transduction histidine kinase
MPFEADRLFNVDVWRPALETFGAVTHLTVALYNDQQHIVCGPFPSTPLFSFMESEGTDPGLFAECAGRCIAQRDTRPAIIVNPSYGLAVVGTSLVLEGEIVGAAVAGYALTDFADSTAISRLARQIGVPFRALWDLARQQQPLPHRRIVLLGELLQVLGDSLLRENLRTRQAAAAAAHLEAMAADKDNFLAVLSHELRSPLTPILGWARILKGPADAALVARAAAVIERNALMQLHMVSDLLDLNRTLRGALVLDVEIVELCEAMSVAVEVVAELALRKQVGIAYLPCDDQTWIQGDVTRLQQIFRNVLINAVKFTPAGGSIAITVTRASHDAVITIVDTGAGIAPAFVPYVFEIFRQQDAAAGRAQGGLGIGLALVKQLVDAHEGTVTVESPGVEQGTTVTMTFPLVPEVGPEPFAERPTESRPGLDGLRVLVVEDMEDVLESTCLMLQRVGADVVSATNGQEALRVVGSSPLDVVLCDLNMPGMDGFQFISSLANRDHPPVIAVSALATVVDHQRTHAAGFDAHLDKPFDDARLLATVGDVLNRRAAR